MLSDAHLHLHEYTPEELATVLQRATEKGVELVVNQGVDVESSEAVVGIGRAHSMAWSAVGIHPWWVTWVTEEIYNRLKALAQDQKVRFIGEIGLDLNRNADKFTTQQQCFREQVRLAREMDLPLNIHCRTADTELLNLLRQEELPSRVGMIHGFSGGLVSLRSSLDMGFYISLGRSALRPAPEMRDVIKEVPLDRLLLETDSTARSYRDEGYEPATVKEVAVEVARIRGMDIGELESIATSNLKQLMGIT